MMCRPPIDAGTAAGNNDLQHIHAVDKQLPNRSSVTVCTDPRQPDGFADHQTSQPVAHISATVLLFTLASHLGSVDGDDLMNKIWK